VSPQRDEVRAAAGDVLAAALDYAARGWPVFPVDGKIPLTPRGFKDATVDVGIVAAAFEVHQGAGVAISTGAAAGLVVIDEDTGHGGGRTRVELEAKLGKLPATFSVLTGGGGKHYYFKHPGGPVPCSAGKLGAGLDVRADGGYVVAPPSSHESGRPYIVATKAELADLPAAWLETILDQQQNGKAEPVADVIPKGKRDSTLASLAGTMRRRGMGEGEILAALMVANRERCRPPLGERDVGRIARSVAGYKPEKRERSAEPFELSILTARALCALPDPPGADELLGPLVVRGQRLILGGHTGEGKTTAMLQIVRAVVLGEAFLEWQGGGGRALVIDAEQGLKTIKRRLREAGLDDSDQVDYVRVPDGLELDSDERHVAEVERLLAVGGYSLVAADPLYKLHAGDSNAEREAVDLMRRFDAWREQFCFALLLPVHCRKPVPGLKFSIHDLFGSSAYVRGAEVVLGLQRVRDGYSRLHYLKDRDGDLPIGTTWGLLFDREQGFRRDPDDGKHEPTTSEQVRELLEATPWMTKAALVAATGRKERTVQIALHDLGAVSRRPEGAGGRSEHVYVLPEQDEAETTDAQPIDTRRALWDEP
jgi:hypothetical protein